MPSPLLECGAGKDRLGSFSLSLSISCYLLIQALGMQGPTTRSSLTFCSPGCDWFCSPFLPQDLSSAGIERVHSCAQRTSEPRRGGPQSGKPGTDQTTLGVPAIRLPRSDRTSLPPAQRGSPGAVRPPTSDAASALLHGAHLVGRPLAREHAV